MSLQIFLPYIYPVFMTTVSIWTEQELLDQIEVEKQKLTNLQAGKSVSDVSGRSIDYSEEEAIRRQLTYLKNELQKVRGEDAIKITNGRPKR